MHDRFRQPRLVLLLGVFLAAAATAGADNWPRFRGPNGTGVSADKGVPLTWTDKENLLWKVEIPGVGNSSPVVRKGKLFLLTSAEDPTVDLAVPQATPAQRKKHKEYTPDQIASVAMFLASPAASFMTGAILPVSGGSECGYGIKEF